MPDKNAEKSPELLFSTAEEKEIILAIGEAENLTSGEIRLHISREADKDALEKTKAVFNELRMHQTKERNAVLIHLSLGSRSFAIYGDEGINQKVEENFWEKTKDKMQEFFIKGQMKEGLINGILDVGERLKKHFPYQSDDRNELPDEISYGE